ncbi:hypothetical protein BX666DRAFT_1222723 [Dichotomocladium elegans]|nr:hypothetical protein BX666DRAFT_1222723 [Dichotomocladium elegans]
MVCLKGYIYERRMSARMGGRQGRERSECVCVCVCVCVSLCKVIDCSGERYGLDMGRKNKKTIRFFENIFLRSFLSFLRLLRYRMRNDNWDTEFPQASSHSFQRSITRPGGAGIISRDPDQELAEALAALQQQQQQQQEEEDDDDDNNDDQETESTFISHHSNKYRFFDDVTKILPDLDDYLYGEKPLVTKLGTHKRVDDMGDWADDLKLLPSTLRHPLSHLKSISRADVLDDLHVSDSVPRKAVQFSSETPQRNFYTPNEDWACQQEEQQHSRKVNGQEEEYKDGEEGEEKDEFDGLEFPDNMADLGIKPRSTSTPSAAPVALSNSIPLAVRQRYILAIEDDDEDFGKDLLVENPNAFILRSTNPKKPVLTSRIPRPAGLQLQQSAEDLSLKARFQQNIVSSSQKRQGAILAPSGTATGQRVRPSAASMTPGRPVAATAHKAPKLERTYGNGSELDGMDLLPEWRRRSLSFWKRENRASDGVDPQRPWRHNMASEN